MLNEDIRKSIFIGNGEIDIDNISNYTNAPIMSSMYYDIAGDLATKLTDAGVTLMSVQGITGFYANAYGHINGVLAANNFTWRVAFMGGE